MATRVGIIGLSAAAESWASMAHAESLQSAPLTAHYSLSALATSSAETAKKSAERWAIDQRKAYSSAGDLANDADVDLVVVSVKLPMHRDLALPALKAGKDVFVEWPLATNLEQVEELRAAAKQGGGRTFMGLQARASPYLRKAKEIIDSGALGKVRASTIIAFDDMILHLPPRYDYEHDAKNRADASTITSAHLLDAQAFLLGEYEYLNSQSTCFYPEIVTAHHDGPVKRDSPDSISVQGKLLTGAVANMSLVLTPPGNPSSLTWTISGDKGALRMEAANANIQIWPPTLSRFSDDKWVEVDVPPLKTKSQTGDLYLAMANPDAWPKGTIVGFDGAALRHRQIEACRESSIDGMRKTYL